ncbi:MAG: LPS-assembly protein LptD [Pseudomonadota bacterium]
MQRQHYALFFIACALANFPARAADTATIPGPVPLTIGADRLQGHQNREVEATGAVEVHKGEQSIYADHAVYSEPDDTVTATGNVRYEQPGARITGPRLEVQLEQETGYAESPIYNLEEIKAHGKAERFLFEGHKKYRARNAVYTSCEADNEWELHVNNLGLDYERDVGTAFNTVIFFKGVPLLYSPYLSFPLHDRRKTGFLTPSVGNTGKTGGEVILPFYWNIAPQRDATISSRFLSKRGLMLNNEFRYLEASYSGRLEADALPNDRVRHQNRYRLAVSHGQNWQGGWNGYLNLQTVSDDTYFTDLSVLSYASGPRNFSGRVQRFQTLQDPLAPTTPPYHRTPQLLLNWGKPIDYGVSASLGTEWVNFSHPTLVNGRRLILYPSASRQFSNIYASVTPKLGVHWTQYTLDYNTTTLRDTTRSVPIFSLDGQVTFVRDANWRGESFTQTLEPRLYYVYAPYREQNQLPNFDTGPVGFGFPQIFSENQFSGGDRINDANRVTLGVTSRLLEADNGNERMRLTVAERFYLRPQRVTLNALPSSEARSDILSALSARVTRLLSLDATAQYNPRDRVTENYSLGLRYLPQAGQVLNLSYRFTRNTLRQVDASAQWPLAGRWQGLARWNYSLQDKSILEGLAGLEYNAGCWSLRLVAHRFASATEDKVNSLFLQLELNGLSNVGNNPLDILRQNIPGYTESRPKP